MTGPSEVSSGEGPVPFWWAAVSIGLVLYAMGYWLWNVPMSATASGRAVVPLEAGEVSDGDILSLAADSPTVAMGRDLFADNCAQCHGKRAEGLTGPNLTDNFWIEGGRPAENYRTIFYGRFGKMPPWGHVLGVDPCKALAAYVETLRGTNENGKPAQGSEVLLSREGDTP